MLACENQKLELLMLADGKEERGKLNGRLSSQAKGVIHEGAGDIRRRKIGIAASEAHDPDSTFCKATKVIAVTLSTTEVCR